MTAKTFQIRKPEARLIVHDQTKLPNPELLYWNEEKPPNTGFDISQDLKSITTLNNLRNPSGAWTAELAYRKARKGMSDEGEAALYKWINPMDIVEIQLNDSNETTMMGMVEQVRNHQYVTSAGVVQGVKLTGRSLGAMWQNDTLKFFPANVTSKKETEISMEGRLPSGFEKRAFQPKMLTKILGEFYGRSPVELIKFITNDVSAVKIKLADGRTIRDFIDTELTIEEGDKTYSTAGFTYEGSIWGLLQQVSAKPFYELFTDSRDGKLILRFRPTPFDKGSWNDLNTWLDGISYHIVPDSDVVSKNLIRSPNESYSIFHVSSVVSAWYGNDAVSEYGMFPPIIDPILYETLGLRLLSTRTSLLPLTFDGDVGKDIASIHKKYRNRLYLWYKDNHRFESGTITIKGNDKIRIGERLVLGNRSRTRTFYIEEVSHHWIYGRRFTTTLNLTRGANETNRNRWLDDGNKYLQEVR